MTKQALQSKKNLRLKRKARVRSRIFGDNKTPRISIFRSNKRLYAQAIDDSEQVTLACVDGKKLNLGNNKDDAKKIAAIFTKELRAKGITKAVFDRNGYLYHGVVEAFADSLRENGIVL